MKLKSSVVIWVVGLLVATVLADAGLARRQEEADRKRLGTPNVVAGHAGNVKVGMPRATVEAVIAGYRQHSIFQAGGETTHTYRYWYGFIPPIPFVRYKSVSIVVVTYTENGHVKQSSYWSG